MIAVLMPLMVYVAKPGIYLPEVKAIRHPHFGGYFLSLGCAGRDGGFLGYRPVSARTNRLADRASRYPLDGVAGHRRPTVWVFGFVLVAFLLLLWRPSKNIVAPMDFLKVKVDEMGALSASEKRVLSTMVIILVLWITESIHHISRAGYPCLACVSWLSLSSNS
jgi:hypothetical protein